MPAPLAGASTRALHRTVTVNGLTIAYREAGPAEAPAVLLLHGFPSSSHMYRELIPLLATRYRVLAPDYPGFGTSSAPAPDAFPYSFASLAEVIEGFTQAVGARDYTLYMQDYGGPVGLRLALRHPERVRGLIFQNAVANVEGWNPDVVAQIAPYWESRTPESEAPVRNLLTADTTRFQYLHGASRPERVAPESYIVDQAGLDQPGNDAIQLELLQAYQDNVALYPAFAAYLRARRPPTLVVWGKNDPFFTLAGVDHVTACIPETEVHLFDAGHFALETHVDEIGAATLAFLDRTLR